MCKVPTSHVSSSQGNLAKTTFSPFTSSFQYRHKHNPYSFAHNIPKEVQGFQYQDTITFQEFHKTNRSTFGRFCTHMIESKARWHHHNLEFFEQASHSALLSHQKVVYTCKKPFIFIYLKEIHIQQKKGAGMCLQTPNSIEIKM